MGGEAWGLGGGGNGEVGVLCGADLPALTFLADKAPHLSP